MTYTTYAVSLVLALGLAGCGGSSGSSPANKVPVVVAGSPAAWSTITVSTPSASAPAPADARAGLAPLLATRVLDKPAPLSEYGLDHPPGTLTYKGTNGSTVTVELGQLNFDRHFVYAQRQGGASVYLVPADTLRATLALVGIDLKPPE
jgi:hypothetical protein